MKLSSDCFCGNRVFKTCIELTLARLLQYFNFQTPLSSVYGDPFQSAPVFGHFPSQLMSSHDLCVCVVVTLGTAALDTPNEVAIWLQMLLLHARH